MTITPIVTNIHLSSIETCVHRQTPTRSQLRGVLKHSYVMNHDSIFTAVGSTMR